MKHLLDHVFYSFEEAYEKHTALDANSEYIGPCFLWYYQNIYVTYIAGNPQSGGRISQGRPLRV